MLTEKYRLEQEKQFREWHERQEKEDTERRKRDEAFRAEEAAQKEKKRLRELRRPPPDRVLENCTVTYTHWECSAHRYHGGRVVTLPLPPHPPLKGTGERNTFWLLDGFSVTAQKPGPTLPAGYTIVGLDDLNGNRKPDILIWNSTTGKTAVLTMNGTALVTKTAGPTIPEG